MELELVPRPEHLNGPVRWLLFQHGRLLLRTDQPELGWLDEKIHHFSCPDPLPELYLGRQRLQ